MCRAQLKIFYIYKHLIYKDKLIYFRGGRKFGTQAASNPVQTACTGWGKYSPAHVQTQNRRITMKTQKAQQGFTLIELMIVIAIVGILAAIALPAYQDYIVRSKMSEPLAALAEGKTTVAEYVAANGRYPGTSNSFGLNTSDRTSSDIIESISVTDSLSPGDIVYLIANVDTCTWDGQTCPSGTSETFSLSGSTNADGTMTWDCIPGDGGSGTPIATKYLPANCRG
jgi:type IV pilus assembly protein PilA